MPNDPWTCCQESRRRIKAEGTANVDMDGPEEGVGNLSLIDFVNESNEVRALPFAP